MFNRIDDIFYSDNFFYTLTPKDYLLFINAINDDVDNIKVTLDKVKYEFFRTFLKELGTSLKFNPLSKKETGALIRGNLNELMIKHIALIKPKVIYKKINLHKVDVGFKTKNNEEVIFNLNHKELNQSNCSSGVVYITSMGDELLKKNNILFNEGDVFNHYVLNGIISAFAEMAANDLQEYIISNGELNNVLRLSPGYGNWKLDDQKKIFSTIKYADKIGVHLNEYNVIIPEKSTSGIMFDVK